MGRTGKRLRMAAWVACAWWVIGCGVDRGPIAGLSGQGGVSAGDGGSSGTSGSGGDSGASGTSGSGATSGAGGTSGSGGSGGAGGTSGSGATSGAGGSAGTISTDASLDSAIGDGSMSADAGDAGGGPIHPDSCNMFRPTGGACPNGWTTVNGITCHRVCTGVGILSNCQETTIVCPAGFACELECQGVNTCPGKIVQCGDGPCSFTCGGVNSCNGVILQCGSDRCTSSCASIMVGSVTPMNTSASCAATDTCQ